VSALVKCGTAASGFMCAIVPRIARPSISWSYTKPAPTVAGTHRPANANKRTAPGPGPSTPNKQSIPAIKAAIVRAHGPKLDSLSLARLAAAGVLAEINKLLAAEKYKPAEVIRTTIDSFRKDVVSTIVVPRTKLLQHFRANGCVSPTLWPLEAELNRVYQAAKQRSEIKALRAAEAQWMHLRETCGSNQSCLKRVYQNRIVQLQGLP
jgi:hypothetical protein